MGGAPTAMARAIARGRATIPTTIPEMTLVRISAKGMKLVGRVGMSAPSLRGAGGLVIQVSRYFYLELSETRSKKSVAGGFLRL